MKTKVVNVHKEPFDVSIMRPSVYGNPFPVSLGRKECIDKFREYFYKRIISDRTFFVAVLKLLGKRIGCCCKPKDCHGDVYVEFFEDLDRINVLASQYEIQWEELE